MSDVVLVKRPSDPEAEAGAICILTRPASMHKLPRYRCGKCLRGSITGRLGAKCKMQGCHAVVVEVSGRKEAR